jgi:hypothetical protein
MMIARKKTSKKKEHVTQEKKKSSILRKQDMRWKKWQRISYDYRFKMFSLQLVRLTGQWILRHYW